MPLVSLREKIIESIKVELGYPEVDVYIKDETISILIDKATRKAIPYAAPIATASKHIVNGKVDLSDLEVAVVRNIYRGDMDVGIDYDIFYRYYHYNRLGDPLLGQDARKYFYDTLAHVGNIAMLEKFVVLDYYQDGNDLYVDNYHGTIVLEYVKKNPTLEDLSSEWLAWVEGYATALSKIAEGRIRGKFRVQGAPFETNADELVSEGQSERSELENRLEQSMGYFNIVR